MSRSNDLDMQTTPQYDFATVSNHRGTSLQLSLPRYIPINTGNYYLQETADRNVVLSVVEIE
jgi:hypothetical protein